MPALATLTAEYRRRLIEVPRRVSVRMSDLVITGAPYDKGSLHASFTPSLNGSVDPYREIEGGSRYPQRSTVQAVASALRLGGTYSLGTAAPYARRTEYGWSGQAPSGYMRIAIAQHQPVTDEAVRSVR